MRAALYAVVAAYIAYLGYSTTPLARRARRPRARQWPGYWAPRFIAAAAGVLVYTWLRYRRELAAAEYTDEEYAELARRGGEGEDGE